MHGHLVRHARKPRRRSRIRVMNGETPVCTNAHTIDHRDIRLGGSTGLTRGSDHDCSQDSSSGGALHDRRHAVGRLRKRRRAHPGAPRGGAETGQNDGRPTTRPRRRMMGARGPTARTPLVIHPRRRRGDAEVVTGVSRTRRGLRPGWWGLVAEVCYRLFPHPPTFLFHLGPEPEHPCRSRCSLPTLTAGVMQCTPDIKSAALSSLEALIPRAPV